MPDYAIVVHMQKHRFALMLPIHLWERIKDMASRNRRPVTQEIILAIERHVEKEDMPKAGGQGIL